MLIFYGEGLLAPRPTPKLEDQPMSFSMAAYSIYPQLPYMAQGHPSNHYPRMCHAVVTRDPLNMATYLTKINKIKTNVTCKIVKNAA
jgi:hypothetical protein